MSFINDPFASPTSQQKRAGTLFVAPEGQVFIAGTRALYERIGYRNPDFDLGDYAVRNMGFVSIGRTTPGCLRIRFRPALVTGTAVEAVCRHLLRSGADEIEVNSLTDKWSTEVWPNGPRVTQRLAELCSDPMSADPAVTTPFEVKPLDLEPATTDYSNPLKPMFQKWRSAFGRFDGTTLPFLSRFGFLPRLVIITSPNAGEAPRFQFIGSGVRAYEDEATMMQLIGQPVDQQPNKAYGEWICSQYRGMIDAWQPRLDAVQVAMPRNEQDVRRFSYDRLLLPWRSENGTPLLTVTTVVTSDSKATAAAANENSPNDSPPLSRDFSRRRSQNGRQKELDLR